METVQLDGSQGEGGGQILRTALSLSALTGRPLAIDRIRAGRRRPGLLRQHLTAVRAAAELSGARVEGDALGSASLRFTPGAVRGGRHRFAIGSAGSACLVCQTVLPILLHAETPSEIVFEGGTHNPLAPSYDFLAEAFFPLLRRMGLTIESEIERHGFYPAGGGRFRLRVEPTAALTPIELLEVAPEARVEATAIFSSLPFHVAQRELDAVRAALPTASCRPREVRSPGPGNVLSIRIARALVGSDHEVVEICSAYGERRKPAERVAQDAIAEARELLVSDAPVGPHLADQLLLPLALAGGGAFRTLAPTEHTRTNAEVIRRFLDVAIAIEREDRGTFRVTVG